MNTDARGPHTHDETEGMFPHLHHQENVDEHGKHYPEGDPHGHHVHVTPLWPMVGTFVALILLTILTVVTAKGLYFGNAINLVIALIIAGTKGVLVAAFFMHLLYDRAINTVIVIATMFAVVLFISLTVVDLGTRDLADPIEAGEIVPGGGAQIDIDAETGERSIKPTYNPWHMGDQASSSVLDQAREAYKAEKTHGGEKTDQAQAPADDAEQSAAEADNANPDADPNATSDADATPDADPAQDQQGAAEAQPNG